jgi:Asp-tRNA(Asn)/Glu-tRNA(Gln) amidotransferase A subunit family amidase
MQLIGRHFDEATLYRFGHAYEEAMIQDQQPAVR